MRTPVIKNSDHTRDTKMRSGQHAGDEPLVPLGGLPYPYREDETFFGLPHVDPCWDDEGINTIKGRG
jgi:hypothetical protein